MIGYIDNNLDGMWKPCTEEKFYEIVGSQAVARTIAAVRAGNKNRKRALPAFIFCGEVDEAAYQTYAEKCRQTGEKRKGSRCAQFLRPTGLFMMDFDRTEGEAMELYRKFLSTMREAEIPTDGMLALAHRTPGGHGLRLVLRGRKDSTPEEDQKWIAGLMDEPYDAACKDLSRLSYAVTLDDLFFVDGKLLFGELEEVEYADERRSVIEESKELSALTSQGIKADSSHQSEHLALTPSDSLKDYELSYDGLPYDKIVSALADQLGGAPEHGARNNFIFSMACHLRYVCNDDPAWIERILPTYGEAQEKVSATIRSAVNRPQSRTMPLIMKRALERAKCLQKVESSPSLLREEVPPMPENLPPLIELLVKNVPPHARAAVAHAVFPALGAHLGGVKFRYIDNVEHEATFMCVLMAKMSSGKGAVNKPIDYILADIKERDAYNRLREQEWKESIATKGANKEKPKRPEGLCIQVLVSDMTNAAFVQRLNDAEGKFLYTRMDEIELLDNLKTSGRGNQVGQIIRLAFDQGEYGQERVGAQSVTAKVQVRWNWNASATIKRGKWYFRNALTDGTLSRLNFCTMDVYRGDLLPVYGTYDERFAEELRPYIDNLNAARGVVECEDAKQLACKLLRENAELVTLSDNEAFESLSFRANVIAYLKAMTLYIAHGEWSDEIADFVRWSEEYDLWCKMRFFGDQLSQELQEEEGRLEKIRPHNLLNELTECFVFDDLVNLRKMAGLKNGSAGAREMLRNWKRRGYIEEGKEPDTFVKRSVGQRSQD